MTDASIQIELAKTVKTQASHLDDVSRRWDFTTFAAAVKNKFKRFVFPWYGVCIFYLFCREGENQFSWQIFGEVSVVFFDD